MGFDPATLKRLFGYSHAFDHPVTTGAVVFIALLLAAFGALLPTLKKSKRVSEEMHAELHARWKSWCWLVLLIVTPILLGAAWTIAAVTLLSLLCYREYARVIGIFREPAVSVCAVAGILALGFASLDHFDRLYFALGPIGVALIVVAALPTDRPSGYLQRTASGVFGYALFGFSIGYLGLAANIGDLGNGADYRPLLILIFGAVEMNDVFAFCCGKLMGGPKLLPNTSPGKTISGSAGAMVLTTLLVEFLG
ncbi:MAG: phosphatidate cytidylyltransferase, partial [Planctomycetales bacterium]